jgi:hypothetical protein
MLQDIIEEDLSLYAANGISRGWLQIARQVLASGFQI